MRAINATVMRQVNRTLILNHIRLRPISRAELAEETGLTRASVTQIVEELITEGLVIETSIIGRSRLGRRSTQLAINPRSGVIFGVNLDRSHCTVGAVNMRGAVMYQNTELVSGRTPEEVLSAVADTIKNQIHLIGVTPAQIRGVGMCAPGPVNSDQGRILTPCSFDGWHNLPIGPMLSERIGLPVHLESAADAQALEEKYFGRLGDNFILLRIDESVSVGVVVRGRLYRGAPDFPVELGLCPAVPGDGSRLDRLISIPALLADTPYRSWEELVEHGAADGAFDRLVSLLGVSIANIIHAYRIDSVVLAGPLGQSAALRDRLNAVIRRACHFPIASGPIQPGVDSDPIRMSASPAYHTLFQTEFESSCCRAG